MKYVFKRKKIMIAVWDWDIKSKLFIIKRSNCIYSWLKYIKINNWKTTQHSRLVKERVQVRASGLVICFLFSNKRG